MALFSGALSCRLTPMGSNNGMEGRMRKGSPLRRLESAFQIRMGEFWSTIRNSEKTKRQQNNRKQRWNVKNVVNIVACSGWLFGICFQESYVGSGYCDQGAWGDPA
ncbi:hypothetical protein DL95DRAFT_403023 [Leptodontidium sp. 2 PMI_412]|nr:hypothetical protein DL95DRAFT_403023 [Leptodontidium sp. 2 PMI_412]